MSLKNYSTTAASNTSAPPDGCPEGWSLSSINDWGRQVMADVRTLAASDTIASATTCDLGSLDATFLTVSGVTTITGLGTVSAGIYKHVTFSGALTLTHNATSLILPGAANITTVAGDTALFLSLGSGNWKCMGYTSSGVAPLKPGVYQPLDALLTALAGQTTAANNVQAYSGADTPTLLSTGTASGNIPLVDSGATVLPAGAVMHFAMNSAPTGWLKANGAAVSRTTYASLFTAIGTLYGVGDGSTTFNLPDLRGEFVRGFDDARGADPARAFGSWQDSDNKSHTHTAIQSGDTTLNANPGIPALSGHSAGGQQAVNYSGGAESRPRNVALLACIKY